ncbi:MAG: proton-conducting transporter membrane subunit [Devosia sp.]|nr:proton-conducting transporter membrane subunit [Devosia sp.]
MIIFPVILSLGGAALLLMLHGRLLSPALLAFGVAAAVVACDLVLLVRVTTEGPLAMTMGRWLPPFGISFTADVTGAVFALVAGVVTMAVLAYSQVEPGEAREGSGFHALALVLLAGVSGAFLTGDLFNLYVWFEVMLIASFGLLILSGTPQVLDGAIKYGLLNFVGTSLFLAGLGLLYGTLGTLNMADIIGSAPKAPTAVMTAIAALFLVAFGTKAAAFPVNAWLPASYHTPSTAVSALLGGLLTKVGVYALLRTLVLLLPASRDLLQPILAAVAGATLLLAPLGVLAETNLRRAVGYMLIGGAGATLAGIALPVAVGVSGAVVYVVHAMLTISALYLVSGLIERATGTSDIRRMGGLYVASPMLALLFFVLIVGVAGVPPFLGFWPKLLLVQGAMELGLPSGAAARPTDFVALALAVCLLLNAFLTLIAGVRLWAHIFWRDVPDFVAAAGPGATAPPATVTGATFGTGAVIALVAIILALGFWPEALLEVGRAAAAGLRNPASYVAAVGLPVAVP